jgi:hypothetical protein
VSRKRHEGKEIHFAQSKALLRRLGGLPFAGVAGSAGHDMTQYEEIAL